MQRRTSVDPLRFERPDVREHVEGQQVIKTDRQIYSEAERLARLGKARAALADALMRLAKREPATLA